MEVSVLTMHQPLISLRDIRKHYGGGDKPHVEILHGISMDIHAGEFVAIVGASGSGKSTLMNILGCLDKPSSGHYNFAGRDVAYMDTDELAWLRREAFGFVFQGYHLITTETAQENVEMPALYAGMSESARAERAKALLTRLGLAERLQYRPQQLSGGQQQRVSIARALMNGGHIILADEPTGALDSRSGEEVIRLLNELADAGHTIILITHDRNVAARARRIIEIRDGHVISDTGFANTAADDRAKTSHMPALKFAASDTGIQWRGDMLEACRAAWRVMWVNRFRTGLTLLGIIIGVASVIVMLAVGMGTKERVVAELGAFGTNHIYVYPKRESSSIPGRGINAADMEALGDLPQISYVLPNFSGSKVVRFGNQDAQTRIKGSRAAMSRMLSWPVIKGSFFTEEDDERMTTVAVVGQRLVQNLMPDVGNPIGETILIGNVPFQVIGVLASKGAVTGDQSDDDIVVIPYSTASLRVFGEREPSYVTLEVKDMASIDAAAESIDALLFSRHSVRDFQIENAAAWIAAQAKTQDSMGFMLALIAVVSLGVGGIGVMNVMLMTVRERTREIGIRMATGARQRDILQQFLTEAVLVTTVGGVTGVVIGLSIGIALVLFGMPVIFSLSAILGAFFCSVVTGLIFGFMPARKAASLDPVVALANE
ncbi:MacB family efflux pump subunit [Methylophilus sp. OH31]|uniref:MacB family efflux pump subunit n=1 Tax=Methylophilus sp. OH31 TaxID=1387312 RepID=UPI00272DFA3D|nr:MacB family efflux pump subunit [Methylophilus sp. OH31]